uniref:Uncharacterized protein n=1 Tax=Rhizophora mucronata TaxID=61149 RepID=A0A2P2PNB7_RHIMU
MQHRIIFLATLKTLDQVCSNHRGRFKFLSTCTSLTAAST